MKMKRGARMLILPITLTAAGLAALINFWLAMRVGRVRTGQKISIGDGGDARLIAAMRAQSNFVEYTPFVLILIGLIELATGTHSWLWIVMALYMLGRVAHGLGMTDSLPRGRMVGTLVTFLTLVALALYALAIPHMAAETIAPVEMIDAA